MRKEKALILIVDDQEMNRALLSDMLEEDYQILEAVDGVEAMEQLKSRKTEIASVLLDVRMPRMDGFEVLSLMKNSRQLESIPVIMISNDDTPESVERSYALGAADYINRPFNNYIVKKRVENTIFLYEKTNSLTDLVKDQVAEKEKNNSDMITILSAVAEFRNGESGMHTLRIRIISEILLECLMHRYPDYGLDYSAIADISNAAALHDIGKIAIPEEILNKPGKLTEGEFEVMKTHSAQGADMLDKMKGIMGRNPMFEYARQICRWHHERWNGLGYPDGLSGSDIPVCAQVVALADVYDALTSIRVYKPPYTHEQAIGMIFNGECGQFNPKILKVLEEVADSLPVRIESNSVRQDRLFDTQEISQEIMFRKDVLSERTIYLLEEERIKYQFLAALSDEIIFDYDTDTDTITFSEKGSTQLNLPSSITAVTQNLTQITAASEEVLSELSRKVKGTTPVMPIIQEQCQLTLPNGEKAWFEVVLRTMWSHSVVPKIKGVIGKIMNINGQKIENQRLWNLAARDSLTNLFNRVTAQRLIGDFLQERSKKLSAYIFLDVDDFKCINDTNGHSYGDHILNRVAEVISSNIRSGDVAARMGGDEFIIFLKDMEFEEVVYRQTQRIFNAFGEGMKENQLTVSMGVSIYPKDGRSFEELTSHADQALYEAKRRGKNQCVFYQTEAGM